MLLKFKLICFWSGLLTVVALLYQAMVNHSLGFNFIPNCGIHGLNYQTDSMKTIGGCYVVSVLCNTDCFSVWMGIQC